MDKLLMLVEIISLVNFFSEFLVNWWWEMPRLRWPDCFGWLPFQSCYCCKLSMKEGDPAIYAERAGYDKLWHPACFVCSACQELLVDMIYFWKNGKLYCGRHYCDSEKPRCAGCDEVCSLRPPQAGYFLYLHRVPLPSNKAILSRKVTWINQASVALFTCRGDEWKRKSFNFSHSEWPC